MRSLPRHLLTFLLLAATAMGQLRIIGSDILSGLVQEDMKAYSKNNDADIIVDMQGSRLALDLIRNGQGDVGLVYLQPEQKPEMEGLVFIPVAYQTAVFVLRKSIPIDEIDYPRLAATYAGGRFDNALRWGDVGVIGAWSAKEIVPVVYTGRRSLALEVFRYKAMENSPLKSEVLRFNDEIEVLQSISTQEGGIALVGTPPQGLPLLKVLSVSDQRGGTAYPPTPENVDSGRYPLSWPLYAVFRREDVAKCGLLLRYFIGKDAIPLWHKAGLIELSEQRRGEFLFKLEVL